MYAPLIQSTKHQLKFNHPVLNSLEEKKSAENKRNFHFCFSHLNVISTFSKRFKYTIIPNTIRKKNG